MAIAPRWASHKDRVVDPGMARAEDGHVNLLAGSLAVTTNNPADAPSRAHRPFNMNAGRVQAIEVLVAHRYGGPCTTDDWSSYLSVGLNAIALRATGNGRRATPQSLIAWATEWLPTAPHEFVANLAEKVVARPRRMTACKAGELLAVSEAEWRALDLKTVHPVDISPEAIEAERKARKAEADRKRRRVKQEAKGGKTREAFVRESVAEQARREGVSRKTIYAWRKAENQAERQGNTLRADNRKMVSNKGAQPVTQPPKSLIPSDMRRAAKARLLDAVISAFSNPSVSSAPPSGAAR